MIGQVIFCGDYPVKRAAECGIFEEPSSLIGKFKFTQLWKRRVIRGILHLVFVFS